MLNAAQHWSTIALDTLKEDFSSPQAPEQGGPVHSARALAMVHAAFHDAYVTGAGAGTPYRFNTKSQIATSPVLAQLSGARAAYWMLRNLYPRQDALIAAQFTAFLNLMETQQTKPTPADLKEAARIGDRVAGDLWTARRPDTTGHPAATKAPLPRVHGAHAVDPVSDNLINGVPSIYGEYWGLTGPFVADKSDFLNVRADAPPRLDSKTYRDDFNEVKAKGHVARRDLSIKETQIGFFWAYDGAHRIGTPPRLYNQVVHRIAEADGLDEAKWSELLCRCNLAMADAGIAAWDTKYYYYFWRPVVGIQRDLIAPDQTWRPIGAPATYRRLGEVDFTPPFPAYTSGHATFGAACFETLKLFRQKTLGKNVDDSDKMNLELVSDELNGDAYDIDPNSKRPPIPLTYTSIDKMISDNLESRVWLGVHWRFDGVHGEKTGRGLARVIYEKF